ncbi:phage portal protein [Lactiplantibacillus plantarum]|uniref:phage portal protein n=1 Tax=Lactiplantibacillus plantarum TaxID=1590 RepID=UPI001C1F9098|nr:phage portal protein [Lactiplantibacillus plantarum]MBU7446230.1 phage portal protein [Lactiplantibacillus plantarum]MBU7459365.1 phage portal protein [Lactiplantibacillus plantarum]
MSFFVQNTNTSLQADSSDAFLDALISLSSDDPSMFVGASALKNSDVLAGVNVIAGTIAGSKILCDSPIISKMLNNAPSEHYNAFSFWYSLVANLILNGNSFAEILPNHNLGLLLNSKMTVKYDSDTGLVKYIYKSDDGTERQIAPDSILHFKILTTNGVSGISPLYGLQDAMKLQKNGDKLLNGFFSNPSTSVLKVHKTDLSSNAKNAIREKFRQANSNSLGTIVIDDAMDYSTIQIDTGLLRLVNSSNWATDKIAACLFIPSELLGVENAHSSIEQSLRIMFLQGLSVYLNAITSELTFKLKGDNFEFDTSSIMPAEQNEVYSNVFDGVKNGVLTINEARQQLNLPEIANGDNVIVSANSRSLNQLVQNNDSNNK